MQQRTTKAREKFAGSLTPWKGYDKRAIRALKAEIRKQVRQAAKDYQIRAAARVEKFVSEISGRRPPEQP